MITEQDYLCYCILTLQYVKRHYVAGYLQSPNYETHQIGPKWVIYHISEQIKEVNPYAEPPIPKFGLL